MAPGWESVYLAMEYVPLGDLEDNVVKLGGKIGEGEVKEITVQILEGLKIMHLESFVHRDLKPKVGNSALAFDFIFADSLLECLSLSSIAKLVGKARRFWLEQASDRGHGFQDTDRHSSLYGSGNSQLYTWTLRIYICGGYLGSWMHHVPADHRNSSVSTRPVADLALWG